jgi:GNAT superfamily N-acetyltransferase
MPVTIRTVETRKDKKAFINLSWQIYKGNPAWVPPLRRDLWQTLDPERNHFLLSGPFRLFLAFRNGKPVGRVLAGIDRKTNEAKGKCEGYLSLFECVDDYECARALLDTACAYLRANGATAVRGPVSPTNGDDYRGFLLNDFANPPVLMNSYNPPYYPEFFERYGFSKHIDLYAYIFDVHVPRTPEAVTYAMERYGFTVEPINLNRLEDELADIKRVLDEAMPEEWPDLIPPDEEALREIAKTLRPLADPEFILIARHNGRPIGFNITLPDYNQVLLHLRDGRLFPFGWLKFLFWKRKIDGLRFFVLFVVPDFRRKGVSAAIFLRTFAAVEKSRRYRWVEGSTIGETNHRMRRDVERAGGRHYRTYRIYRKAL